ncbi:TetR/AcrR family transcriptional regulator [Sphaerisporangium fuscum]|uniref:TetR/AcrR family transcriptional regulator n=1 Tax=Sphaerisporangium fuscum TaxID=2835868 RepID=UPI001BDD612E|nr:TetR/AcrR family transcriptional regulator [Sphaerisporangium fuscum]
MSAGRPRDPAVDDAIRRAALALTAEAGYAGLSMEGIAARAGVAKQTIYRRYRSKGEAVLDALSATAAVDLPAPDIGSLRGDIEALLRDSFRALRGVSGVVNRALMTEALQDEKFAELFRRRHIDVRRDVVRHIVARARGRGEVAAGVDEEFLIDLAFGPMWYRLLVGHGPLDDAYAAEVAAALALVASGG